ncbi:ubiquitin carboxyl-terminal hydrolase 3 isoform X2 [Clupea harengus]|uniref:Ubiquitin carboxyl-terminal hydrolase n=1 Tax=Clupea harengus TaxID=7950 RepID=A0A6P8F9T0_CLUHA|nr:ubiquitin carboxyl-terminal hydrolase 3 isoform X2 [Clupea harengus]
MECPHLSSNVWVTVDPSKFPNGSPSSWCCGVCRSNKSPWVCLTCLNVHCGRYVNGHAKKHYEETQGLAAGQKKCDKTEKERCQHCVCMDCCSYSTFCYRCDEFVVNDTKLGHVQKVRVHLQSLENATLNDRKRKLHENSPLDSKLLKDESAVSTLSATGLRNLGNTCFMNAILQSLSNIEQFSCYFKELPAVALRSGKTAGRRMYHTRSQGDSSVSLVEEFRKTLCSLWQGSQTAFSPDALFYVIWKIMPSFRGYQQQDAHEFMRYLLDHLHRELQGSRNGAHRSPVSADAIKAEDKCWINGTSTVVTSIFGGILQSEVNCLICGTESRKLDPFLDLSLDIPSQFRIKRSKDQEPGPTCTLRDCLRSFTELEELDETELYMCYKCKKRQKSTKKFWVQKLPKVLCLHLKRFHWTAYLRNKVDTYVEFPMRGLGMRNYLLEPESALPQDCLYDLAAVVVHHGSGVGSGHYTAYGSNEGRWYHFNDSTVTLTDEATVRKAKAYILFYVARTETDTGTGTEMGPGVVTGQTGTGLEAAVDTGSDSGLCVGSGPQESSGAHPTLQPSEEESSE